MKSGKAGIPLLVLGIVFIAIGAAGQSTFLGVGVAFLAAGIVIQMRARKEAGK